MTIIATSGCARLRRIAFSAVGGLGGVGIRRRRGEDHPRYAPPEHTAMTLLRRCCLLLAFLLLATGLAHGAAVSERSPVRLGLWYDPAHSGSGFELFSAGQDQVLVWY